MPLHIRVLLGLSLLALTACSSGAPSPGLRQGPGRVAGNVVFRQPVIEVRTQSPDQAEADGQSKLMAPANISLYAQGEELATRNLASQRWQAGMVQDYSNMTLDYAGNGEYLMPFDFSDVPLGSYVLGFAHSTDSDFGMVSHTIFDTRQPVSLDKAQQEVTGVEHPIPGGNGSADGTSITGKLLVSGNPVDYVPAPSIGTKDPTPIPPDNYDAPQGIWSEFILNAKPSLFGRYFFSVDDVAPALYGFGRWHSVPGQFGNLYWTDEENAHDNPNLYTLQVDATGQQGASGVTAYASRTWSHEWPGGDYRENHQAEYGELDVALSLPAGLDWSHDTVLVAESNGADKSGNHMAFNYVVPQHFATDGLAHYRLAYLAEGTYTVTIRQLGATNSDPVATVATYGSPVTLPSDTPFPDFNWGMDDVPYAGIEFTYEQPPTTR